MQPGDTVGYNEVKPFHPQHHGIYSKGGIARSIVVDTGAHSPYPDKWIVPGEVLEYSGQGKEGTEDHVWNRYNLSLRRAMEDETSIHVFEKVGHSPEKYKFWGQWYATAVNECILPPSGQRVFRFVVTKVKNPAGPASSLPVLAAAGLASDVQEPPARYTATTSRIVRDTRLSSRLKTAYRHKCQLCGFQQTTGAGQYYSEGHHIRPLGRPHNGPDARGNIIVLCSRHHVDFDYGVVAINPADCVTIRHPFDQTIDGKKVKLVVGHALLKEHLDYHWSQIYKSAPPPTP